MKERRLNGMSGWALLSKRDGAWFCKKDCEICGGSARVESGMEGFINRNMEQDCRSTYDRCENAEFIERDYPDTIREANE